jgi:hypothetical protein
MGKCVLHLSSIKLQPYNNIEGKFNTLRIKESNSLP